MNIIKYNYTTNHNISHNVLPSVKFLVLAFVAGTMAKIYDDLDDNKLFQKFGKNGKYIKEYLKGFQYVAITILAIKFPMMFLFAYVIILTNYISSPNDYKNSYEWSLLTTMPILFLFINYSKLFLPNKYEITLFLGLLIGTFLESKIIKKEYSSFKLITRVFGLLSFIFIFVYGYYYNLFSIEIFASLLYVIGYLVVSVVFQFLLCTGYLKSNNQIIK